MTETEMMPKVFFFWGRQLKYLQYEQQGMILYGAINTTRKHIFTKNTTWQFVFAENFRTSALASVCLRYWYEEKES